MKGYQENFSLQHPEIYFGGSGRPQKADKMLRILHDAIDIDPGTAHALDIGCSTGAMSRLLAEHFGTVTGIDIDQPAIDHASRTYGTDRLRFRHGDAMQTLLPPNSIDVVICAHVYEHVPDPKRMMDEIDRILRPGGICYFAAENRLVWREGDYRLPLLSVLPKWLAHHYIRLAGRADEYYETLLTYWQLKDLTSAFIREDYTRRVVVAPERFAATDMIQPGSLRQKLALAVLDHAYWLFPDYLWILRKRQA